MIRIFYATRANLCLRRAHTHNILKTVELLECHNDTHITLVVSGRQSCAVEEMIDRHGVAKPFVFARARWLPWFLARRRTSFDMLYVRDPRLIFSMIAARLLGKKVIFEIHGSREWPLLYWLWKLAFRIAHAHVFITYALQKAYRPHKKPHAVIPCVGVDLAAFAAPPKPLRKEYNLSVDTSLLLYLGGSQGIYYHVTLLVDMMEWLPKNAVLFLIGLKDREAKIARARAETLGIKNRVFCIARVNPPEIPSYLCAADVLLNPKVKGYAGSVSSKLYEYLAAGKPIVASLVPADREVISEQNAFIVEPMAHAFARAVKQLYENPEERKRLGARARADAENYTWEERQRKLIEFIKNL